MPKNSFRILLADDDSIDRELFMEGIHGVSVPYTVDEVTNGQEVLDYLEKCENNFPDFIFLDLNMPVMDGREVLVTLKKSEKYSVIPIFIFSTSSSQHDVLASYKAGANLFLVKPSEFDQLVATLTNILELFQRSIATVEVN